MEPNTTDKKSPGLLLQAWRLYDRGQDKPNLIAFVETLLCIAAFWWLTLHYETMLFLWSSVIIAPLLFLRSESSMKSSVEWFLSGLPWLRNRIYLRDSENPASATAKRKFWHLLNWISVFVGLLLGAALGYPLMKFLLVGYEGIEGFYRGICFGICIIWVSIAATEILTEMESGAAAEVTKASILVSRLSQLAIVLALTILITLFLLTKIASLIITFSVLIGVVLGGAMISFFLLKNTGGVIGLLLISPGLFVGTAFQALMLRLFATLRNINSGFEAMPENVWRTGTSTRVFGMPELVPGLPAGSVGTLSALITTIRTGLRHPYSKERIVSLLLLIALPFWFLPSLFYRIILKSTLWLWWVLYFLGGTPSLAGGAKGLRAKVYANWFAATGGCVAVYTIVSLVFGPTLKAALLTAASSNPVIAQALIMLIDWSGFTRFQLFSLIAAIFKIVAFFLGKYALFF